MRPEFVVILMLLQCTALGSVSCTFAVRVARAGGILNTLFGWTMAALMGAIATGCAFFILTILFNIATLE